MTATQLDLFGQVEAADQQAADHHALVAELIYARELANADMGYQLCREAASGWPNGEPSGAQDAIEASYAERERASLGQLVPGAPGACRRCHHATVYHRACRYDCLAADCDCEELLDPIVEHLHVEVLPGGVLSVRTVADVMTERWAQYGEAWPNLARAQAVAKAPLW